ncbi:Ubiquitin fusion degradation UFD1 family protein isoform 1 [Hibiscus syriacus]|uniref:Ubiquitin fusion degradation UFD1 family protein isoform 1 n=1 Tax=Hibiscus syriacus TaxID=106335 RepID=A0A6A2YM96_HIBSY|nr:Ubiquitin fusion degradation UFD1 family protein isoform 1 [Hibiscus syriacus]
MEYENQYQHVAEAKYDCLLFDVDDTLYPLSSGLSKASTRNIEEFMVQKLGVEGDKVSEVNRVLYRNYGTSIAGLRAIGYNFDYDEYHSFVHGRLPYENLKHDHVLRNLLLSLPIRKVVNLLLIDGTVDFCPRLYTKTRVHITKYCSDGSGGDGGGGGNSNGDNDDGDNVDGCDENEPCECDDVDGVKDDRFEG